MVKYKAYIEGGTPLIEKTEIDRVTDKSVFIGKERHSIKNYFDSPKEAKIFLDNLHTQTLRNTANTFMVVKDLGECGFQLYDNKYKTMRPCGVRGCVVTKGIHLCENHFKSAIGSSKTWNMFNIKEEPIITINRFLEEIKKGGLGEIKN